MTNKSKAIRQHHFGGTVDLQWSTLWAMLNSSRTGTCQRLFFFWEETQTLPKGEVRLGVGRWGWGWEKEWHQDHLLSPTRRRGVQEGHKRWWGGRKRERERPWVRGWNENWFRAPPFLPLPLCIGGGKVEGGGEGVGTNRISGKDNRVLSAL